MTWLISHKVLVLNILAVLYAAIQYVLDNNLANNIVPWLGLVLVILDLVMQQLQSQQIAKLKVKLAANKIPY